SPEHIGPVPAWLHGGDDVAEGPGAGPQVERPEGGDPQTLRRAVLRAPRIDDCGDLCQGGLTASRVYTHLGPNVLRPRTENANALRPSELDSHQQRLDPVPFGSAHHPTCLVELTT